MKNKKPLTPDDVLLGAGASTLILGIINIVLTLILVEVVPEYKGYTNLNFGQTAVIGIYGVSYVLTAVSLLFLAFSFPAAATGSGDPWNWGSIVMEVCVVVSLLIAAYVVYQIFESFVPTTWAALTHFILALVGIVSFAIAPAIQKGSD